LRRPLVAAAALLVASSALAHDFWLAPSKFRVGRNEAVDIAQRCGVAYEGEAVYRSDLRTERFVVLGPDGTAEVPGKDRSDPSGRVTLPKDGVYVVALLSKRRSIEVDAPKFEEYLKEEGLDSVAKLRADRKLTDKPGREVFVRCAKALLHVGAGAAEGHDRVAGLRLEVVPETNPFVVASGAELSFRVLFEEKPLPAALVVARSRAEPKHVVSSRTDGDGRVKLTLDRAGEWMVKCVHMVEAPVETGMDWESLWGSVTFDLSAR
jgi:uncharacterized GH25 family protein